MAGDFEFTEYIGNDVPNCEQKTVKMTYPEGSTTFPLPNAVNYLQTIDNGFTFEPPFNRRNDAFESVQEAILDKVTEAIDDDNIKRAKELLTLAKKLKELK